MSSASSYRYYFYFHFEFTSPIGTEEIKKMWSKWYRKWNIQNNWFVTIRSIPMAHGTALNSGIWFRFAKIASMALSMFFAQRVCERMCVCVFLMLFITSYFMYYSVDFCCLFSHQRHNVRRTVSQSQSVYDDNEGESKKLVMKKQSRKINENKSIDSNDESVVDKKNQFLRFSYTTTVLA